ncbi:MAG TPA: hemerythrin domain-containing protein [Ilumatobacteraceae bacterium]
MNDPMTILKADHREVRRMLTALSESEEGREREQMTSEVEKALTLHMQIEENILYPAVAEHVGADDEEEAEIEHGLARDGLTKMVGMVQQPGFGAVAQMLLGGIEHHVQEEEGEILPALKEALPREEWLALGDAIAQAKADAGEPVPQPRPRRSQRRKSSSKRR